MSSNAKQSIITVNKGGDAVRMSGAQPPAIADGGRGAVRTVPFNVDPVIDPPVVTGSKGANAALTSLMAALVQLGLVVDQTS